MENLKKYLVEFIGTFFLVFVVASTALWGGDGVIPAIAIGAALMVMVYAGGYISGGHYNPAVSLAAAIRGALPWIQWVPYAIFQILGGLAAAFAASKLPVATTVDAGCFDITTVIVAEFIFTFALCYVVLLTATSSRTEGNSYYGLAIGATVMVGAFAVGGICLGAFNPAVALSTIFFGAACCKTIAITIGTNLVAGLVAGCVYKFLNED